MTVHRPTYTIPGLFRFFAVPVFAVLAIPLLSCKQDGPNSIPFQTGFTDGWQCNTPFTDLFHHDMSGFFNEKDFRVIDNSNDWCALWPKMTTTPYSPPPCDLSLVDFSTEVAILAADPDAVWLTITCVQEDTATSRARVLVEESVLDPPGCILFLRKPYPVHVVKVARVALAASFVKERTSICTKQP